MDHQFQIEGPFIELIGLIKALGIAQNGGHAKAIVEQGIVYRNGERELRKRAKLVRGDIIQIEALKIQLQ